MLVSDKSANTAEKTKEVFVFNTAGLSSDTNALIAAAESGLKSLDIKAKKFSQYGLSSDALSAGLESGLAALQESKKSLSARLFDEANASARKAKDFFSKADSAVDLNIVASDKFIFNKQQIKLLLEAAGLPQETIADAEFLIKQADVSRELDVLQVRDENNTYYKVAILVSLNFKKRFLADNNINSITLVEIIPKDFAQDATGIFSDRQFEVVEKDPKISFRLDANSLAEDSKIVYALKADFSEQTAVNFVSSGIVNKFVAPPVLVSGAYSSPAMGLPQLTLDLPVLLGIAAVAIIVAAIVFVFLFVMPKLQGQHRHKKKWWK